MPSPNTDAPPQNKHDSSSAAPDRPQLPAVAAGPFAAAGSLPSGKGKERVTGVDTGPTLEEQQRRFQTASVIRDWEISAWYSVAGREVGLSLHFPFPLSLYIDTSPLRLLLSVKHHTGFSFTTIQNTYLLANVFVVDSPNPLEIHEKLDKAE